VITEIVHFDLPRGITREELLAKYRQTAPAWASNADLVRKYYFFDAERRLGGGVYIWKDMPAALRWHGEEYKARIRALYGSEPRISHYDTLLVVDNEDALLHEPSEA
jgi:hypothetical protein